MCDIYGDGTALKESVNLSSPKSLRLLCEKSVKAWKVEGLNVAYAQMTFPRALQDWENENMFSGSWTINTDDGHSYNIDRWYAQPARTDEHIFQPIIDPHHIYVNNRCRCCSKGMPSMGISPCAWWYVAKDSKNNGTGLSVELAIELRDRQRNELAQTTFAEAVEKEMQQHGFINEAKWCSLIRNFYRACDESEISVAQRIEYFLDIRNHLLSFARLGHFPPPGQYVADLPISQFEGILTNIDRRLQLYSMLKSKTYNQRAISSLDSAFQVSDIWNLQELPHSECTFHSPIKSKILL